MAGRWNFRLNILRNRLPFKGTVGQTFMDVIWQTLQNAFVPALNYVYNAEFLTAATGEALDFWGEVYGVARDDGEDDTTYRNRIMRSINKDRYVLTTAAIRQRIVDLSDLKDVNVIELYRRFYDWQNGITWGEKREISSIFGKYEDVLKLLIIIPYGLNDIILDKVSQAIIETVLSPAEVLIVSGNDVSTYNLERRVHDV